MQSSGVSTSINTREDLLRTVKCKACSSHCTTVAGSEEDLDKALAAEYDEPPEASKAGRDDWMTSTEGRNILTGEFAPKDGDDKEAAKDDAPKISVTHRSQRKL